jgi:hypothetical protein
LSLGETGMGEMVRSRGKRARDNDRSLDAKSCQFTGVADSKGIHGGLCSEVRREVRRRAAARTAAANPNYETFALLTQRGQHCAVHSLCAEDIHVVELGELLRSKRFCGSENHMPCVVDENIESTVLIENLLECNIDRFLRCHVHFNPAKVTAMFFGERC